MMWFETFNVPAPSFPNYSCAWARITARASCRQVQCVAALAPSHCCGRAQLGWRDLIKGRHDEQGCVFSLSSLLVLSLGLLLEVGQLLALSTFCSQRFAKETCRIWVKQRRSPGCLPAGSELCSHPGWWGWRRRAVVSPSLQGSSWVCLPQLPGMQEGVPAAAWGGGVWLGCFACGISGSARMWGRYY